MKRFESTLSLLRFMSLCIFFFIVTKANAQDPDYYKFEQQDKELIENYIDIIIWNVKALLPSGKLLPVKAIDKNGDMHPVKAIQDFDQTQLLDFKAFVSGKSLPIKLLLKEKKKYYPLKAIDKDGTILDIKAITDKGKQLAIKGISQSGNIIHIAAILNDGDFYNIIAISPKGEMNIVKGVKMYKDTLETTVNGVKIFAHVKAIKQ